MGNERLINICRKVGANEFLSGSGGFDYMRPDMYEESGVKLYYQKFAYPEYEQLHGDFVPNLSIIDMLLNVGPDASKFMLNKRFISQLR